MKTELITNVSHDIKMCIRDSLIMFAVLLAASALGIAYLINYGAYADGGEQVLSLIHI